MQPLTHNSTARRMAKTILNGFRSYFADYLNSTLTAKSRFESADWHGVRQANVERLDIYKEKITQTVEYLKVITNKNISDLQIWQDAKTAYTQLIFNFPNFEIAETFLIQYSVTFMSMTKFLTKLSMFFLLNLLRRQRPSTVFS